MAAIRHANGIEWWVLTRQRKNNGICNSSFDKYIVNSDTIKYAGSQEIGFFVCDPNDVYGEMTVSPNGEFIAVNYPLENTIDLLRFDRCSGKLIHLITIPFIGNGEGPYSNQFSLNAKVLYVTAGDGGQGGLFQLEFNSNYTNYTQRTIWSNNSSLGVGQLEMAPDGKIYMSVYNSNQTRIAENTHLSVIHQPDSIGLACDFRPFSFYVGDSAMTTYGLPNMPNYNLGATSIYQTNAGIDTFYCTTDTTKGVTIGANPINGVTYQWQNTDIAEPDKLIQIVKPPTSTWYYLQITDTSIVGSCTSRIDSVFVEVRVCVGIEELELNNIRVYPNPTSSSVSVISSGVEMSALASNFELYSLLGEQVLTQTITTNQTSIPFNLPNGIYIYKILAAGKVLSSNKLIIVQ